jgi:hypothetical protein
VAIDILNSIADAWFRLGFASAADMAAGSPWVTATEAYQYADDAVKALGRRGSIFLTADFSINVVGGTQGYALPAGHVFTESAWLAYAGGAIQQLRLTGAGQLTALDANWPVTAGNPTRLSMDAIDVNTACLYPVPIGAAVLWQVIEELPATVALGASTLALPLPLQDYFTDAIIAGSLSKESDSARPDVAAHLMERMKMLDAIYDHLWGGGR